MYPYSRNIVNGREQQLSAAKVEEQLIPLGCGWCHQARERGPSITIKAYWVDKSMHTHGGKHFFYGFEPKD